MKYAIVSPCDQTVALYTLDGDTLSYKEAHLFDSEEEAKGVLADMNKKTRAWQTQQLGEPICEEWSWIEEVPDEAAWRSQPDTW